jgi:hypothetical protein
MPIQGYREYRKREFCSDVMCPAQEKLNSLKEGSDEYERVREECKRACRHSTHTFHKWLIEHGFLIVKKEGHGG